MKNNYFVLPLIKIYYTVLSCFIPGVLDSKQVKSEGVFLLTIKQGPAGPSIQAVFCSIDRPFMDDLQPGDSIV